MIELLLHYFGFLFKTNLLSWEKNYLLSICSFNLQQSIAPWKPPLCHLSRLWLQCSRYPHERIPASCKDNVCLCVSKRQNHPASTLGSSLLRCDKLEQAEIKSLLMCFLHVLKSMSEGSLSFHLHPAHSVLSWCSNKTNKEETDSTVSISSRCFVHILEQGFTFWVNGFLHSYRVRHPWFLSLSEALKSWVCFFLKSL